MSRDCSSRDDFSQGLPCFNRKGWKSFPLRNVNRISPNWSRLKRLIPIEHHRTRRLTSYQLNSPGAVGVWFTIVLALTFKGLSVNSQSRSQTMTSLTQRHCLTIHCRNKVSYHDLKRHSICHASHVLSPVPLVLLITSHLIVLLVFTDLHLFIHSFVISFCFLWYILVLYPSREQIKMNRAVICVY